MRLETFFVSIFRLGNQCCQGSGQSTVMLSINCYVDGLHYMHYCCRAHVHESLHTPLHQHVMGPVYTTTAWSIFILLPCSLLWPSSSATSKTTAPREQDGPHLCSRSTAPLVSADARLQLSCDLFVLALQVDFIYPSSSHHRKHCFLINSDWRTFLIPRISLAKNPGLTPALTTH